MNTLRLKADPFLSPVDLEMAVSLLMQGRVVAMPTETVYGLAADAFQEAAIAEIFRLKGRPSDNPLIVHVCDFEQANRVAFDIPQPFAETFWPGPLTLVLRRRPEVPALVSAGLPSIAIRMPSHPCALQLIGMVNSPLAAPSANLSGRPSPTQACDVFDDFNNRIPAIIDGGACQIGIESTVLSLIHDKPTLLRLGAISKEELEMALGMTVQIEQGSIHSPGSRHRHYAPRARIRIVKTPAELAEWPDAYQLSNNFSTSNFYAHLRQADRQGFRDIVIHVDETIRANLALMDRLERAAGLK